MSSTVRSDPVFLRSDAHAALFLGEEPVTFQFIVDALREGATAEAIADRCPAHSLADVHSVIGYYLRHQAEIDDYLNSQDRHAGADRPGSVLSFLVPTRALLRSLLQALLVAWLPVFLLYAVATLLTTTSTVTMRQLTQDPTTVLDAPFYIGIISTIGNVLWVAAATVCLFTPLFLSRWISKPWRDFLLFSGLFTILLLFDDVFLLHDDILPNYLNVSGEIYGVTYVLLILFYLLRFRQRILHSNYLLLGIALACFATSAGVDLAYEPLRDLFSPRLVLLVEDGAKLLGITTWLAYFVHLTFTLLSANAGQHVVYEYRPRSSPVARAQRPKS